MSGIFPTNLDAATFRPPPPLPEPEPAELPSGAELPPEGFERDASSPAFSGNPPLTPEQREILAEMDAQEAADAAAVPEFERRDLVYTSGPFQGRYTAIAPVGDAGITIEGDPR